MEGFAKVVLVLTVLLGALSVDVNGARTLKNFACLGGTGTGTGTLPNLGPFPTIPGFTGSFPGAGGFPFDSSSFCSLPGVKCTPALPSSSVGSNGGAAVAASP